MSTTVDRRVVEMRFDNQQFESRTRTTLGTLEKLKNALNFSHASDGLDKLNKTASNIKMSGLKNAVDGVQVSFSKMEAAALAALTNLTNRAVDAGVALAKNLTVDQLSAGWQKYADKTTAVQTIMAATKNQFTDTAEQMEFVNDQLDKLNWFTDETSYNFVDMVSNIGKFTSANIALDDSVTAMEGIATWAAVSGQNATVASRAMYQLSQALGAGAVKLLDWRSIENANMNTYEFKETALETAVSLGILQKEADGVYKTVEDGTKITNEGFRDSLQLGWFTSDVLMKTLEKYGGFTDKIHEVSDATGISATELLQLMDRYREAGDSASEMLSEVAKANKIDVEELQQYMEQLTDDVYELGEKAFRAGQEAKTFQEAVDSVKDAVSTGWMNTFEIIFGDYEEARVRWTALANELWDIFASGAEARNELLEEALGLPENIVHEQTTGWSEVEKAVQDAGIPLAKFIHMCLVLGGKEGQGLEAIEAFKNSLSEGWLTGDIVNQAMERLGVPIQTAAKAAETAGHSFEDFQTIVSEVLEGNHGWGNGNERFRKFTEAGWNFNKLQDAVNKAYYGGIPTLEDYEAALGIASDEELRRIKYTDEEIKSLREVKNEYTEFNGVITDSVVGYEDLRSGSELLFEGISNGWNAIKGIFSAMKQGWDIAFPPMTADRLYDILAAFNSVANRFNDWVGNWDTSEGTPISETVEHIRDTFAGLGSAIGLGLDVLKEAAKFLKDTFGPSVSSGASIVLEYTARIGNLIKNFRRWVDENQIIRKGLEQIKSRTEAAWMAFTGWLTELEKLPTVQKWLISLESWFSSIGDTIIDTFPNAAKRISGLWFSIKNLFKNGAGFTALTNSIKAFGKALWEDIVAGWEKLKSDDFFGGFARGLDSIWAGIKTLDPSAFSSWAKSIWDGVKQFFQPVPDFFIGLGGKLVDYAEDVNRGFRTVGDVIKDAAGYLKEHVGSIIAALIAFTAARSVYNFIQTIINLAKAVTAPVATIVNAFDGFARAAKGIKNAANALAIVEVALAISGLAWTVVAIGQVPKYKLERGLTVVFLMGVIVVAIIAMMAHFREAGAKLKPKSFSQSIAGMFKLVELAGAIMLVAMAFEKVIKAVDGKTWSQIWPILLGMGTAITILAGISIAVSRLSGAGGAGSTGPLLAMAALVYVLSEVFQDILTAIDNVTDASQIDLAKQIILDMVGAVGIIAIALAGIGKLSPHNGSVKIGGGILAVALSVKLLISAFKDIMGMTITWDDGKTKVLIGLITAIGLIMAALSALPNKAGSNGLGMLAMAASVEILVIAIKTMAGIDGGDIAKGIIAVGALIGFITLFSVIGGLGKNLGGKSALALLGLATAILIMSGAIALLSLLDEDDVFTGTLALSALIVAVGVMLGLSAVAGDLKVGQFIGLSIVIGVLAAAIVALSFCDPGAVLLGTVAISAMIIACGVMMMLSSIASKLNIGHFLGLIGIVAALTLCLRALAELSPQQAAVAVIALTSVMAAFTVMTVVIGLATRMMATSGGPGAIIALGLLAIIVAAIGGIIILLTKTIKDPMGALVICEGLSKVLTSLASVTKVVAAFGAIGIGGALQGIAGMILVLGAMAGLSAALGWINEKVPALQETIQKGFPVLRTIGQTIGEVIGGIVQGIFDFDITGVVGQLTTFATSIGSMSEALSGITVNEGALTALKSIGECLLYLAGADLMNAVTNLLGGGTSSFSTAFDGLDEFGKDLAAFGENFTGDIDVDKIGKAAEAAEKITDLIDKLPKSGGWAQTILGESESLSQFGIDLVMFGGALYGFNNAIKGEDFDADKIGKTADAANKLGDLIDKLPEKDGWKQKILGEPQTLSDFGKSLGTFGSSMKSLASDTEGVGGLTEDDLTAVGVACDMAQKLVDLSENLGQDEGWLTKIFGGDMDIEEFASQLSQFGQAMHDICSDDKGVGGLTDSTAIDTAITIAGKIRDLVLAGEDGTSVDVSKIGDLSKKIDDFGEKFGNFYEDVENVDTTLLTKLTTNISTLVKSISTAAVQLTDDNMNNLNTAINGIISLVPQDSVQIGYFGTFADKISDMAISFSKLNSTVDSLDTEALGSTIVALQELFRTINTNNSISEGVDFSGIEALSEAMSGLVTSGVADFLAEFQNSGTLLDAAITALVENIKASFAGHSDDFTQAGKTSSADYSTGLKDAVSIESAVISVVGIAAAKFGSSNTSFIDAGLKSAKAYASGLSGSAALSAVQTAANILRSAVSTSLHLYGSGYTEGSNFGLGFVAGIRGRINSASAAANDIGLEAVRSLKAAIDSSSPSKKTRKLGVFYGSGFVSGIRSWVGKVGEASKEMGLVSLSVLNDAINKVSDLIDQNLDAQPTITPVVDLTQARQAAMSINDMFNKTVNAEASVVGVTGASVAASRVRVASSSQAADSTSASDRKGTTPNYYNTFNITGNDPEEIATKVNIILEKRIRNRRVAYGGNNF